MDFYTVVSLVVLGAVAGFAAGLLGIGGGMLLVPFLILLLPLSGVPADITIHSAIATSMATIVFTSMSSLRAHHKRGAIRWDIVALIVPGLIIGGILSGGAIFAFLSAAVLSLFFGLFVAYSAVKMLVGKAPPASNVMPGKLATTGAGIGIGFISGLVGAGGGFLSVPFMVRGNVAMHNAVATSAALGFFIAIANCAGYIFSGFQHTSSQSGMLGYIYWPALLVVSAMSVFTAPLGAQFAHALPVKTLKRVFACFLFTLAAFMLHKAFLEFIA